MSTPLAPLRVVTLESRQAVESARLFERHGCQVISAPSMREIPHADQHAALRFGEELMAGRCDVLILMTGVGAKLLVEVLSTRWSLEEILQTLARTQLVSRGPKSVAVLKGFGLRPTAVADEPNTWQDLLPLLGASVIVDGKRVVVQEHGEPSNELCAALRERGAHVQALALYGWTLPADLAPLRAGVLALCDGGADVVAFTSQRQLDHLFQIAEQLGKTQALATALQQRVLVASVGPVTSVALRQRGVPVDLVPVHSKLGHLVLAIAKDGPALLQQKRASLG